MLPAIGYMVAATGGIIALYVALRCIELMAKPETGEGMKMLAFLVLVGAIGGGVWIGLSAAALTESALSTSDLLRGY